MGVGKKAEKQGFSSWEKSGNLWGTL